MVKHGNPWHETSKCPLIQILVPTLTQIPPPLMPPSKPLPDPSRASCHSPKDLCHSLVHVISGLRVGHETDQGVLEPTCNQALSNLTMAEGGSGPGSLW